MMEKPYVVSVLRFDSQTDRLIRQFMRHIHGIAGLSMPSDPLLHLSLVPSALDDCCDLIERLRVLLDHRSALHVTFSHLGVFSGGVVFLGVTPTEELLFTHRRVFEVSSPRLDASWSALYSPDQWVPHCTLAVGASEDDLRAILKHAQAVIPLPLCAQCVAVELLEVSSNRVRMLKRIDLSM